MPLAAGCLSLSPLDWKPEFADCIQLRVEPSRIEVHEPQEAAFAAILTNECGEPVPLQRPHCTQILPPVRASLRLDGTNYRMGQHGAAAPSLGETCESNTDDSLLALKDGAEWRTSFAWNGSLMKGGRMDVHGELLGQGDWEPLPEGDYVINVRARHAYEYEEIPTWESNLTATLR